MTLTNGVYASATLYLKSGVELHLAKDAVLQGSAKPADYDDVDDPRIKKAPERSKKAFLVCLAGENVAITGEGTTVRGSPIVFNVDPSITLRDFGHVILRDLRIASKGPIVLKGTAETPLRNMRLERISGTIAASVPIETQAVDGLEMADVRLSSGRPKSVPFTWTWKSDSWESVP